MKKNCTLLFFLITLATAVSAQSNTSEEKYSSVFDRISKEVKNYKLDTSLAPNDKITRKIIELRNLRGGFNINEAIEYKLEEDKQKGEITEAEVIKFSEFITKGDGKRWLDNAVIAIYRQHFTFKELKQLVKFYKTPAGQKMSTEFPVIMMQSLIAGESIKNLFVPKGF